MRILNERTRMEDARGPLNEKRNHKTGGFCTMKKLLAISLSLALLLTTVACGNNKNEEPSSSEGSGYEDVMNPESSLESSTDEPEGDEAEDPEAPAEEEEDENTPSGNNSSNQKPTQNKPASGSNSSSGSSGSSNTSSKPSAPASNNYSGTLPELINAIYAKQPVELALSDPTAIDLSDANAVTYYLGLNDTSKVKEAYYSEALIGSQAYSLVVVRTNSAADAPAVAQSMFDGINQSKWVCVTADCLAVGAYGDTVMLAMVSSELNPTLHTDLRSAYASAVGGKLDVSLDRTGASA